MTEPIYVVVSFVSTFLSVLSVAILARVVFGMFFEGDGPVIRYLWVVTEPAILPFRKLFEKRGWFEESPMDVAATTGLMVVTLMRLVIVFYTETVL